MKNSLFRTMKHKITPIPNQKLSERHYKSDQKSFDQDGLQTQTIK